MIHRGWTKLKEEGTIAEETQLRQNKYLNQTTRLREELGYIEPIAEQEALLQTIAWEHENLVATNTR